MYYIYMLRCRDGSFYTGIAADIEKRLRQHASGGAAWEAGVQAGDILVSIDGESLSSAEDLTRILSAHAVGDTVELYLYRSGREGTVTATLTEARE